METGVHVDLRLRTLELGGGHALLRKSATFSETTHAKVLWKNLLASIFPYGIIPIEAEESSGELGKMEFDKGQSGPKLRRSTHQAAKEP